MAQFFKPKNKNKIETKHQECLITKLDHQGDGIAFLNNKALFVAGALPNEKVLVQLTESKKNYAKAKLIKVLEASPERVEPFCPYYKKCGGCNLQHLKHDEQITQKQQILSELMSKFAGATTIQAPAVVDKAQGYRRRARFSLKVEKDSKLQLGFRQRASDNIISINSCPVLEKNLDALLPKLQALLDSLQGKKRLGHIELSTSEQGTVFFVRAIKKLSHIDIEQIKTFSLQQSLILYIKQGDDETARIFETEPYYLIENLKLKYKPQNFLQVNEAINLKMVSQAIDWLEIQDSDSVLDLFCGLGNFTLPLAKKAKLAVGVEGVSSMVLQALQNAKLNGLDNAEFYHADLSADIAKASWAKTQYQKILLDPARAGAFELMPYVAKSGAKKILYVSCNPATLARDSQVLLSFGYRLEKLGLLDMFPHTGHLESMALFVKN